ELGKGVGGDWVGGLHVIAGIDQTKPDTARDRRDNAAIGNVQRLRVDQALVLFYRADILLDDEDLILGLLPGDRVLLGERLVTFEIHLRLREQALIFGKLAFILLL